LVGHRINSYCIAKVYMSPKCSQRFTGTVLGFFSSRPNWDSPTPSPAGECVLPSFGSARGTHSLRKRGWGVPIQTRGQTLVVL
jgi:hypothetical protein